jgi:hypothetical protein
MKNYTKMSFKISTPDKILFVVKLIRIRWEEHVASVGLGRGAYRLLVGKPEGKRPPERRGHRLQTIFKKQNRTMDWTDLAQDMDMWWVLVNAVINLRVS